MNDFPDISIVVPMHNEEGNVVPLWEAVDNVIPRLDRNVELILVNDGSTDDTGRLLEELAAKDTRVRVIELDGNWGQASAFCAGFEAARGSIIMTMDGDLQNDPEDFPRALAKLEEGFRVVTGWRRDRKERYWNRVLPSMCANWLIGRVTGVPIHDNGCGLKAYRAEVVKGTYLPRGFNRFMPAIFGVKADEVAEIIANDRKRLAGHTHYGLERIFIVLKDLMAIPWIRRNPSRYRTVFSVLRILSGVGAVGFFALRIAGGSGYWLIVATLLFLMALICQLIVQNLDRFLETQQSKGFRIRRVIGDAAEAETTDRNAAL